MREGIKRTLFFRLCGLFALIQLAVLLVAQTAFGESATWSLNPTSTDWSVRENWMPATVPNCASCVATFGTSALPQVDLFGRNGTFRTETVAQVTFTPGASAYTITAHASGALDFDGAGLVNESGIQQNFKTETEVGSVGVGQFFFSNNASAGTNLNTFTNGGNTGGGEFGSGGACQFNDGSTAGTAMFVNEGGSLLGAGGGEVNFYFNSTAGNATIINGGATALGSTGGQVYFESSATAGESVIVNNGAENNGGSGGRVIFGSGTSAGSAQITNNGGTVSGAGGGTVSFSSGHAGTATIINNGGIVAGAGGAVLSLVNLTTADQSVLVANGGTNGGDGGQIVISDRVNGGSAQFKLFGNGSLDISRHSAPGVTIGSLEGDGIVFLGTRNLSIGSNALSTAFLGTIQDGTGNGGSLTKLGTGTLKLAGANRYIGGTFVEEGSLIVNNRAGSATGTGVVEVNAGILGGKGIIAGSVTIGTGSGAGAFLAPGAGARKTNTLTIEGALTIKADGTYSYRVKTKRAEADQVIANGVTIESGAQFSFKQLANKQLTAGTVFTAIDNTSANPITGTFSNLPDGSTFTSGRNNYQTSYSGGDGNDLTLTVVP